MKKFFNIFFVSLGVIFFILILLTVVLFLADPLGLRSQNDTGPEGDSTATTQTTTTTGTEPVLNEAQTKALETFGIDPAAVNSITPEQEACFVGKLGQSRVDEIKAGDAPTALDFLKAASCVN